VLGQDKALLLGWAVSATKICVRPSVQYSQKRRRRKKQILRGHVLEADPTCIRIGYVSDM